MAVANDYVTGTITLTNGSTTFTGTGTAWRLAGFRDGDRIYVDNLVAIIAPNSPTDPLIDSNTQGKLTSPWTGTTGTRSYRMSYKPDGARTAAETRNLIELLGNGNIEQIASLTPTPNALIRGNAGGTAWEGFNATLAAFSTFGTIVAANKAIYYTDANTAATYDLTGSGRSLVGLNVIADRMAYGSASGVWSLTNLTESGRSLIGLNVIADRMAYGSASGVWSLTNLTATGRAVIASADAAAVRTTIAAASSVTQVFSGEIESTNNISVRAARVNSTTGASNTGGILTSWIGSNVQNLSAQFFASEIVGTAVRAGIAANAGGSVSYLLFTHTGNLAVPGTLSKGAGTFLIDHPLDPFNKDLAHGFVESPRYELIYRGKIKLTNGYATVDIDAASHMTSGTFEALTTNATVTSIQNQDGFARVRPMPIDGGTFEIICEDETSNDEISWTVIAERNDAFVRVMDDNCDDEGRFIPERDKEAM